MSPFNLRKMTTGPRSTAAPGSAAYVCAYTTDSCSMAARTVASAGPNIQRCAPEATILFIALGVTIAAAHSPREMQLARSIALAALPAAHVGRVDNTAWRLHTSRTPCQ